MVSKRQKASAARRAKFWADRHAAARTPRERAVLAWERSRSSLKGLAGDAADAGWALLAERLSATEREIRIANFDAEAPGLEPNGQTRPRAREATTPTGHSQLPAGVGR